MIGRIDNIICRWGDVRSSATSNNLMDLPGQYSMGDMMILKESWQALDRVTTEIDAIGTESQFGVQRVIGSETARYNNGKKQSTSVLVPIGEQTVEQDRKSTRLNSSHSGESRMPSSA